MTNKHGVMMLPVLLHPKSRGTIRLANTDPLQYPLIDPNYLQHPDDIELLLEGMMELTRECLKDGTTINMYYYHVAISCGCDGMTGNFKPYHRNYIFILEIKYMYIILGN